MLSDGPLRPPWMASRDTVSTFISVGFGIVAYFCPIDP